MRNLVIQYYIDIQKYTQPGYNNLKPSPIEEYSTHSFKQYCGKFDLDYCRITEPKINFKHPTWERFDLWTDPSWWGRYEQIMYVDSDVVALPDALLNSPDTTGTGKCQWRFMLRATETRSSKT